MREESSPGLRLPRTFTSLRHPNYRLYFLGQLGSLIGFWMQHAAQSWLICELSGSKAMLGIAGLVANAPIPLLSIVGGHLADRYPKRRILGPAVAGGGAIARWGPGPGARPSVRSGPRCWEPGSAH